MIAKLAGILDQIGPEGAVIDVNGVGYLTFCSTRTIGRLPPPGDTTRLLIETHVREDHIHLYGFIDSAERDWFRLLMTVQGVGARLALAILSAVAPGDLTLAIVAQDRAMLARAEGVGPRLAARIVNELRDKVGGLAVAANGAAPAGPSSSMDLGASADAVSALVNLGYRRAEAFGAVAAASRRLGEGAAVDALIRAGLRVVSGADDRVVAPGPGDQDAAEASIRPQTLDEFVGQRRLRDNLAIFIEAAKSRHEALDHVLFFGPPGLGKTTLAQIVARELGVGFRATSGPVIQRAGDLAALLTNLQPRDVMFIDEIHRLMPAVEEILYPAMEDFQLDLIIGEGPGARSIRIDLPPFTLIGATTRSGLITRPLRERFGIPLHLLFYEPAELTLIVARGARVLSFSLEPDGAAEIARRARGTPRVAMRLLRRIRDFAAVQGWATVDAATADLALLRLEVDARGLDGMDRRYLRCIAENYGGGPVGVETMAAALGDQRDVIEEVIEPYLLQEGFVQRTPRGRMLTETAFRHLDLPVPVPVPVTVPGQFDLLAPLALGEAGMDAEDGVL